jgi:hypothetical protein
MAELVDALDSKSGYRKVVQVRFLFWAQRPGTQVSVFFFARNRRKFICERLSAEKNSDAFGGERSLGTPPSWELQAERS